MKVLLEEKSRTPVLCQFLTLTLTSKLCRAIVSHCSHPELLEPLCAGAGVLCVHVRLTLGWMLGT